MCKINIHTHCSLFIQVQVHLNIEGMLCIYVKFKKEYWKIIFN